MPGVGSAGRKLRLGGGPTLVYVGEVSTEPRDGLQHGCPVWPVERLDGFGVEILNGLLVTPAHAVLCACVPVKRIDRLGDSHLGSRHRWGCQSRNDTKQIPGAYLLENQGIPLPLSVIAM